MIAEYLAETRSRPFVWGMTDCAHWCADLVTRATGYDPAIEWRAKFRTARECQRILMQRGGLMQIVPPPMACLEPIRTDGVVIAETSLDGGPCGHVCGVLFKGRLIIKGDRNIVLPTNFSVLKGWSLCLKPW